MANKIRRVGKDRKKSPRSKTNSIALAMLQNPSLTKATKAGRKRHKRKMRKISREK